MLRKEFTKKTKREALKRSDGLCEAEGELYGLAHKRRCSANLGTGIHYDHFVRAADGGSNDLDNCKAVCRTCHSYKTKYFDVPEAAKTKRMSDKAKGIKRAKPTIKSAPFQKSDKKPKIDKSALAKTALPKTGGIAGRYQ